MNLCKFTIDSKKLCRVILVVPIILLSIANGTAAFEKSEIGAAQIAMGNAGVAVYYRPHLIYYNPALLYRADNLQLVMSYQNYYGITDLNGIDFSCSFPVGGCGVSCALNRLGNFLYQELKFSAAGGFQIIPDCALGISTQLYYLKIHKYGHQMSWGINVSAFYTLLPELSVGAYVTNINQPHIAQNKETLPLSFNVGFSCQPVSTMTLAFEVYRDIRYVQEYRFGFSYSIFSSLIFRAGIEDQKDVYSFGVGIISDWIDLDYAVQIHHSLGVSQTINVILDI